MFVLKITDNGFKVTFDSDKVVVENKKGDVKLIASRFNDLYYVKSSNNRYNRTSQLKSTEIIEIVHSDVCGPMRVESIGGSRYIATFVDDHTRWCKVSFLKRKNDVSTELVRYKTGMENLTGKRKNFLQSDN